jgi:CHAD domain-containing protein
LADGLARRLPPAIEALRGDVDGGEDPREALHQLRVGTRRLRAFVSLFAAALGDKRARRLRRRLRRITRAAGEVRQWDAHLELLEPVLARTEDSLSRAAIEHVVDGIGRERTAAAERAAKILERARRVALADELEQALDVVNARLLRAGAQAGPLVRPWVADRMRVAAERAGEAVHDEDIDRLHQVRIAAKRVRYVLELTRPALDERQLQLRRLAKRSQQAIGRHHDEALLEHLFATRRDDLRAQGHATLAGALDRLARDAAARRHALYENLRDRAVALSGPRLRLEADAIETPPLTAPPPDDRGEGSAS